MAVDAPPRLVGFIDRLAWAFTVLVVLGVPVGASVVVEQFTPFGRNVTTGYLAVVATVLPVVFLAAVLEARAVVGGAAAQMPERSRRRAARMLYLSGLLFLEAEGVALYAVGQRSRPTTFLVLLPVIVGVWIVIAMFADMTAAIGLSPGLGEVDRRQRRIMKRILERRADRLSALGLPDAIAQAEWLRRAAREFDGPAETDDSSTTGPSSVD
jgi:hypothetical protein